jgi:hypothetical protein
MDYHPDLVSQPTEKSSNLLCVWRAFSVFHRNFFYFGLAFLVPVLLAYAIHGAANTAARSAIHGARPSALPLPRLAAVAALRWGGFGLAAVMFGFVAGGVAVVVRELRSSNERPAFERALEQPRARLAAIAGSALVQFFGLMLSIVICAALAAFVMIKMGSPTSQFRSLFSWIGWTALALCLMVFSRWMLSVSVIVEEGCGIFASFCRSWELTAKYAPAMLFFVAHATIVGYFAGKIPYYAFNLIAGHFALPPWSGWLPFVLSFVFVAFTEPLFAIGCAEAYYSASEGDHRVQHEISLTLPLA